ncbi:DUF6049 family protein [Mobiluncus holmesii]|nr:DUF6049 family protein [Mobiluncus holmesii]STY89607.1 Uncharacterised protein [Mobiluncus holmesii]
MRRSIPFISRVLIGLAALSCVSLAGGTPHPAQAQTEKPSPTPSASPCASATSSHSASAFCGPGFNRQGVRLEITAMTPIVTPETTELTVSALLEVNSNYHHAAQGTLHLNVSNQTPLTREELNEWMDVQGNDARLQRKVQTVATLPIEHLTAGKPQPVTLHVPVTDLPLGRSDQWGPRPLSLTFVPDAAATEKVSSSTDLASFSAQDRAFLLWDSGAAFEPSELLTFVPLTTTHADVVAADRELPNLGSRPNQRLMEVCALANATPLTPVFDPFLIATELNGVDEASRLLNLGKPSPSPSTEPRPAVSPLRDLVAAGNCGQQPPAYLPPGDFGAANTSWLAPAAQDLLRTTAVDLGTKVTQRIPEYQGNLVLWPDFSVRYSPSGDVAQEVSTWGNHPLLLSPDSGFKEVGKSPAYDTDSRQRIEFSAAGNTTSAAGWTLDGDLSRLLNGQPAFDASQTPADYRLSAVGARQWALASTAVLTRQRPFAPRVFAAGAGRDYSATPVQKAVMQGLGQARWLSFPAWNTVLPPVSEAAGTQTRTVTVPAPTPAGQTDSSSFSTGSKAAIPGGKPLTWFTNPTFAAADNLRVGAALSAAMSEPARFNTMFSALQISSACATCTASSPDGTIWAGKSAARQQTPAPHSPQTEEPAPNTIDPDISAAIIDLINSQPASVINLIDKSAQLPISVSNGWDQAVSVRLKLTPSDTRLQFNPVETLTIAPHSIGQFRIPVKAVGSGDVQVTVQLTNPAGQSIGAAETIQVRVRAEWESTGTYIVAGLLAFVLVFGIVRRIVKGPQNRTPKRETIRE